MAYNSNEELLKSWDTEQKQAAFMLQVQVSDQYGSKWGVQLQSRGSKIFDFHEEHKMPTNIEYMGSLSI